ncbi:MAG: arsenate reductase [Chloroflexi bacterium RBG_13_46_9]|nr:MAG: arsenate reductase [Chloroflexi bacterium RBG_13_46_9]
MVRVLFVCVHNSGRSQMAKAFFNALAINKGIADSAGTRPATGINPTVIQVMHEVGIDISREIPKLLTLELVEQFDRMITMGCGVEETCPAGFLPTEDWGLDDPADKSIEEVRRIRDEIKTRVEKLVAELR